MPWTPWSGALIIRRSRVRTPPAPRRGLHVSVGPIFTFASDILFGGAAVAAVLCAICVLRVTFCMRREFPGVLPLPVVCSCVAVVRVRGGAAVLGRRGGEHGEGLAAAAPGSGGRPWAAQRAFSCCRAFQAARMRWLRVISRVVVNSISGAGPMRRHQPRLMSLVAGSLAVAKPRSAPVRRA